MNILARDHLQPTFSRSLQPRQHRHNHHKTAIEMDWTCDGRRARQHLPHSPSLDTSGETETRVTLEHLASNLRRGAQDPPSHLGAGTVQKLHGPEQTRVGYLFCCLHASRHNRHEWVSEWYARRVQVYSWWCKKQGNRDKQLKRLLRSCVLIKLCQLLIWFLLIFFGLLSCNYYPW